MTVRNSAIRFLPSVVAAALAALAAGVCGPASAFDFHIGDTNIKVDNLFTVGTSWRMQDPDYDNIGKSTLFHMVHPGPGNGLCVRRNSAGEYEDANSGEGVTSGEIGFACSQSNLAANEEFVSRKGSYNSNADNGNLNFAKYDIVHATAKLTSDIGFTAYDFNVFIRPIYFFDANYGRDFERTHADTTFQPAHDALPDAVVDRVGKRFDVLDYNISRVFDVGGRAVSVKVGNQVLNWGESSLLFLNSLNSINPPNATRARIPGFDLKEAFQPQGMLVASTDLIENLSFETFYQYQWLPVRLDPIDTFQSPSDTLGEGQAYAMLGLGKAPDDPTNFYRVVDNEFDPAHVLSTTSGRTAYRDHALERSRLPNDGGQFGGALKFFLEDFNNGTELSFYAANYHSRLPIASLISSDSTCAEPATLTQVTSPAGCNINPATPGQGSDGVNPPGELLPLDSIKLLIEYPENIKMYGVSFNTTVGDFALSGEYAYRPNLPVQIHTVDLTFAALNPAAPDDIISIDAGPARVGLVPGCRWLFPDFVSRYRHVYTRGDPADHSTQCGYGPNEYIQGYERLKVGQAGLTVLRLIGGDNPIAASQMTLLFEMGMTQVFGMPGLDELQFNGGGTDVHITHGADGSAGIMPAYNPLETAGGIPADNSVANDPSLPICPSTSAPQPVSNPINPRCVRATPTTQADLAGFGVPISYGYRFINLNRWDSAVFGANLETLTIIQHDVHGTAPGIGTNFTEGRKQLSFGLRADYLSTYIAEIRYTWFTGGANRDPTRDRDNVFATFGIQF